MIFKKANNKIEAGVSPYIKISDSISEIEQDAFYKYSDLKAIIIPKSIKKINSFAFGFTYIKSIIIPESVSFIGPGILQYCIYLEKVLINTKLLTDIAVGSFFNCSKLLSISIPEGVTIIRESTFVCCRSLKSVFLPDSLKVINNYAFFRCSSLERVIFPETMKGRDGSMSFSECVNLDEETRNKINNIPLLSI